MTEEQFKQFSYSIAQIGFYLMSMGDLSLFEDTPTHRNIASILSLMALKLEDVMDKKDESPIRIANGNLDTPKDKYISKQQVVEMCHPFITQYGINQAIKTNDIPYLRRGNKYFFLESDVQKWINDKKNNVDNLRKSNKYV